MQVTLLALVVLVVGWFLFLVYFGKYHLFFVKNMRSNEDPFVYVVNGRSIVLYAWSTFSPSTLILHCVSRSYHADNYFNIACITNLCFFRSKPDAAQYVAVFMPFWIFAIGVPVTVLLAILHVLSGNKILGVFVSWNKARAISQYHMHISFEGGKV